MKNVRDELYEKIESDILYLNDISYKEGRTLIMDILANMTRADKTALVRFLYANYVRQDKVNKSDIKDLYADPVKLTLDLARVLESLREHKMDTLEAIDEIGKILDEAPRKDKQSRMDKTDIRSEWLKRNESYILGMLFKLNESDIAYIIHKLMINQVQTQHSGQEVQEVQEVQIGNVILSRIYG